MRAPAGYMKAATIALMPEGSSPMGWPMDSIGGAHEDPRMKARA